MASLMMEGVEGAQSQKLAGRPQPPVDRLCNPQKQTRQKLDKNSTNPGMDLGLQDPFSILGVFFAYLKFTKPLKNKLETHF